MDVVGPLVQTNKGHKYVLTVQDAATRYLEAFPMKDQSAETIAKHFVKGIILRHGTPRQLLTDLGTPFLARVMKEICNVLQIERLHTTAYRPQTNGSLERTHRTLKDLISHYITPDQRDWDDWLPFAVSAYCSMTHSSLGESPFYLLYGRDMELPFDTIFKPLKTRYDSDVNYAAEFVQRMKVAHQQAREHLNRATDRVHRVFNKKSKPITFQLGDRVYLHSPAIKPGLSKKLCKTWTGPYRILDIEGVNAQIKEIHGHKTLKVHVNRLKHCLAFAENESRLGDRPKMGQSAQVNELTGVQPIQPPIEKSSHTAVHNQGDGEKELNNNSNVVTGDPNFRQQSTTTSSQRQNSSHNSTTTESTESFASLVEPLAPPTPPKYQTRSRGPVQNQPWVSNHRI